MDESAAKRSNALYLVEQNDKWGYLHNTGTDPTLAAHFIVNQ